MEARCACNRSSTLLIADCSQAAWTSRYFKWHLRAFRVTHYVIFNVILYVFLRMKWRNNVNVKTIKLVHLDYMFQFNGATIQFVKRVQNNVQDDVMRDAKLS